MTLEAANAAPVRYLQDLYSCHQDLEHTTAQIVGEHDVRVDHEELRDERLHHLPFVIEQLNVGLVALLQPLLEIKWPWIACQPPNETESVYL